MSLLSLPFDMPMNVRDDVPAAAQLSFQVELVTPELARKWLGRNEKNRSKNIDFIKSLAADMAAGRWRFTGDPIRFDVNGNLVDGQHRLEGVVLSNTPVRMAVMRGLPTDSQEFIDIGRSRTIGDRLKMRGVDNYAVRAGIARVMLGYKIGAVSTVVNPKSVSNSHVIEFLEETNTDYGVAIVNVTKSMKLAPPAPFGAAAQIAYRVDPQAADTFFGRQLVDGLGLAAGMPALALRNRLLGTNAGSTKDRSDVFWLILRAFVLYQEGRSVSKIQMPKGGWSSETVPHPLVPAHY